MFKRMIYFTTNTLMKEPFESFSNCKHILNFLALFKSLEETLNDAGNKHFWANKY